MRAHIADIEQCKKGLRTVKEKLRSLKEKYIADVIGKYMYKKWRKPVKSDMVAMLEEKIIIPNIPATRIWKKYQDNLAMLSNLSLLYEKCTFHQKQAFVKMVFDGRLYQNGTIYRTPYILPIFAPKAATLAKKQLLIIDNISVVGGDGIIGGLSRQNVEPIEANFQEYLPAQSQYGQYFGECAEIIDNF